MGRHGNSVQHGSGEAGRAKRATHGYRVNYSVGGREGSEKGKGESSPGSGPV